MKIDWLALLKVASVTLLVTVLAVALVATAAKLLDSGHTRLQTGQTARGLLLGAYALFAVVAGIVCFGLYLIIASNFKH